MFVCFKKIYFMEDLIHENNIYADIKILAISIMLEFIFLTF
jgi:hypothetical protein